MASNYVIPDTDSDNSDVEKEILLARDRYMRPIVPYDREPEVS
jgi:hypothetical protein